MEYKMNLQNKPFQMIKNGIKNIEIRLYDDKRKLLRVNDYIIFDNKDHSEIIKTKIVSLFIYNSFKDLFNSFDKESLGYYKDEKCDYNDMYEYYSKEDENKYGLVGIKIKLLGDEENGC